MKTSELTGAALDWAVAKCEGVLLVEHIDGLCSWLEHEVFGYWVVYSPSTDWAQGGPIIAREALCINTQLTRFDWQALDFHGNITQFGSTPLIAAMRCYVASKLGDEVDVPEELA